MSAVTESRWSAQAIARVVLWPYVLVVIAFAAVLSTRTAEAAVVRPLLLLMAILLAFGLLLTRGRITGIHVFEIGPFFATIVALSAAVPAIGFLLSRSPSASGEPWFALPSVTPEMVGTIVSWYAIYLAAFCAAYVLIRRGRGTTRRVTAVAPATSTTLAIVLLFLASKLFFILLGFFFDMSAATYSERYLVLRNLPLVARQLANLFEGIDLTLQTLLLTALFLRYRTSRWLIVLFVAGTIAFHLIRPGARTEMLMVLVGALMLYDLVVRRLALRHIFLAGLAALTLYLAIGVMRRIGTSDERAVTARSVVMARTDFDGIFENGLELAFYNHAEGAFINRPDLYLSDLFGFIPSQLLPFPKTSAAQWFVTTYSPQIYAVGGGRAFGIIAESVVGHGVFELIWRGMLFGVILALVQRRLVTRRQGLYSLAFYIWLAVLSYQSVRNTMFMLPTLIIYRFLTAMLAVSILGYVLRRWDDAVPVPSTTPASAAGHAGPERT